jgi:hypothetical protein
MTRDDAMALSGRELDAAVGRLVMREDTSIGNYIPEYSTTYEGMGLVIEAMRLKGWYAAVIEQIRHSPGPQAWCAVFTKGRRQPLADGATAPEAIVRAALLAVSEG